LTIFKTVAGTLKRSVALEKWLPVTLFTDFLPE